MWDYTASSIQMHFVDNLDVMSYYSDIMEEITMFIHLGLELFSIFRGDVSDSVVYRDLNICVPLSAFKFWFRSFPNPPRQTAASKGIWISFQSTIHT